MNQTVTRTVTNAKLNVIEYAPGDRSARFADAAIPCGVKVIGQVHGVHYVDDRGYNAGYAYIMRFADGTESQEFAREKDACHAIQAPAYPYHPSHDATVTAGDIRQDNNLANAEGHAELTERPCPYCGCDLAYAQWTCQHCNAELQTFDLIDIPFLERAELLRQRVKDEVAPAWNARLAARAAAIVSAAGGLALAIACLTGTPASAQSLPLVPTDGECVVTQQFEDGSATALCGHDVWAYDADGNNPPASVGYTGPRWDAGWYPCIDASCATIDHTR